MLKAMGGGTCKHWNKHLAEATLLVNTRESASQNSPAQFGVVLTVEGGKVPIVHAKNILWKTVGHPGLKQGQANSWDCFCSGTYICLVDQG